MHGRNLVGRYRKESRVSPGVSFGRNLYRILNLPFANRLVRIAYRGRRLPVKISFRRQTAESRDLAVERNLQHCPFYSPNLQSAANFHLKTLVRGRYGARSLSATPDRPEISSPACRLRSHAGAVCDTSKPQRLFGKGKFDRKI